MIRMTKPSTRRGALAVALVLSCIAGDFAGAASVRQEAAARDHDRQVLRRVHDQWIAAYTAGDVEALGRFYLDETVLMPDGRPTYRGWQEIRAFFAPGFERFSYTAQADLQSLEVSGDLGSAHGIVTVTMTPKAGGEAVTRALRYLIVFKRVAKDDWRILLDMDNRVP